MPKEQREVNFNHFSLDLRKKRNFLDNNYQEVLRTQLGDDWKEKFLLFEEKPMSAASIGKIFFSPCNPI